MVTDTNELKEKYFFGESGTIIAINVQGDGIPSYMKGYYIADFSPTATPDKYRTATYRLKDNAGFIQVLISGTGISGSFALYDGKTNERIGNTRGDLYIDPSRNGTLEFLLLLIRL